MPFRATPTAADDERRRAGALLLACARVHLGPEHRGRIDTLARAGIDWHAFLPRARRHGLTSLVYWHVQSTCPEAVPPAILNHLRESFRANACRNLLWTRELCRIVSLLERHGIPVGVFKGPALGSIAYAANPALRRFVDLDILVRPLDAAKAMERLHEAGFVAHPPLPPVTSRALLRCTYEQHFIRWLDGVQVDLHWRLLPDAWSVLADTEPLWSRVQTVTLAGQRVRTLGPEDTLLFLCTHGSKHCWERLAWICDVAALIDAHPSMNWTHLLARSQQHGSRRMLFLGLSLASNWLGAVLPEELSGMIRADPVVTRIATRLRERFVADARHQPSILEHYLHHVYMTRGIRDRARYVARVVMRPRLNDLSLLPWPQAPVACSYVLRPLRLLVKYGYRAMRGMPMRSLR